MSRNYNWPCTHATNQTKPVLFGKWIMLSTDQFTIQHIVNNYSLKCRGKYPPLSPTLRWIIIVLAYHTNWRTSSPKSSYINCDNISTKAILFFFGSSEVNSTWLITSKLANQHMRKVLFTCLVYTNMVCFINTDPLASELSHGAEASFSYKHTTYTCMHQTHSVICSKCMEFVSQKSIKLLTYWSYIQKFS